jgi:hypothetical protein
MPMFKKNLKLIATAVGLVAVLVMGLAMPGATQRVEMPTRGQIVKGLSQLIATLTASEGDILDFENVGFYSFPFYIRSPDDPGTALTTSAFTFARIPLHPSSRSIQLLLNWLTKDEPFGEYLNLGAFYTETEFPGCPGYDRLKAGIYQLKVRQDLKLIATDPEGNEFIIGYVTKKHPETSQSWIGIGAEPDCLPCLISGLIGLVICAFTDPQVCNTSIRCQPVVITRPDGSTEVVVVCWEDQDCWGC